MQKVSSKTDLFRRQFREMKEQMENNSRVFNSKKLLRSNEYEGVPLSCFANFERFSSTEIKGKIKGQE